MRELLSNNSLFVGQLYEDKALALHAHDLIFFTTDLQTGNYKNNSLLELIYFLNNDHNNHIKKYIKQLLHYFGVKMCFQTLQNCQIFHSYTQTRITS